MKILHIAPFNVAGVPLTFVKAERSMGHYSRLITFAKNPRGYPEDICLNLPFLNFRGFTSFKRMIMGKKRTEITNIKPKLSETPPTWQPGEPEQCLIHFREKIWSQKISQAFEQYEIDSFDVIQLDGGIGFFRDGRDIKRLHEKGKKILCCYTGSDLRTRGIIPEIDKISDLNITVEFDHLPLHPNLHHVFFPFDGSKIRPARFSENAVLRIGHAPTNRAAKGSDDIIAVVKKLENKYPVQLVLIENMSYEQALEMKSACHIFIDQIGDLGYGINSLESLVMGIPTCSCLAEGFDDKYPDHPFVVVNAHNLAQRLIRLIEDKSLRMIKGRNGRDWVLKYHDPESVVREIHRLALLESI